MFVLSMYFCGSKWIIFPIQVRGSELNQLWQSVISERFCCLLSTAGFHAAPLSPLRAPLHAEEPGRPRTVPLWRHRPWPGCWGQTHQWPPAAGGRVDWERTRRLLAGHGCKHRRVPGPFRWVLGVNYYCADFFCISLIEREGVMLDFFTPSEPGRVLSVSNKIYCENSDALFMTHIQK